MKIKICKKFPKVKKFEKKLGKAFPDVNIKVKSCISMCKRCKSQPVAKVNGIKVNGESINKIINKMMKT